MGRTSGERVGFPFLVVRVALFARARFSVDDNVGGDIEGRRQEKADKTKKAGRWQRRLRRRCESTRRMTRSRKQTYTQTKTKVEAGAGGQDEKRQDGGDVMAKGLRSDLK